MDECGDAVVVFIATGGELKEEEKNTLALDLLYYSYMKPNLLKIKKLEKEGGSFRRIWSEACFILYAVWGAGNPLKFLCVILS